MHFMYRKKIIFLSVKGVSPLSELQMSPRRAVFTHCSELEGMFFCQLTHQTAVLGSRPSEIPNTSG